MASFSFAGDLTLFIKDDSFDLLEENGLFIPDINLETAIALSLFGGNDSFDQFWANSIVGINIKEKHNSAFNKIVKGMPLSLQNILLAEQQAKKDLSWLISENLATEITINMAQVESKKCKLDINIISDNEIVLKKDFFVVWGGE
ncbi:MAG: hypothetical protein ACRC4W_06795 [Treponemataceae bacterium]